MKILVLVGSPKLSYTLHAKNSPLFCSIAYGLQSQKICNLHTTKLFIANRFGKAKENTVLYAS
jgi:hypothetical protein